MPRARTDTPKPTHQVPYPASLHSHLWGAIEAHCELTVPPGDELEHADDDEGGSDDEHS